MQGGSGMAASPLPLLPQLQASPALPAQLPVAGQVPATVAVAEHTLECSASDIVNVLSLAIEQVSAGNSTAVPTPNGGLADPLVASALQQLRLAWRQADQASGEGCRAQSVPLPVYIWVSSGLPWFANVVQRIALAKGIQMDVQLPPMPSQWRPAFWPDGRVYTARDGFKADTMRWEGLRPPTWVYSRSSSQLVQEAQQVRLQRLGIASLSDEQSAYPVSSLLLFYRKDLLQQRLGAGAATPSVLPPRTWQGLLQLAARLNGSADFNGDGKPNDYALCLNRAPLCDGHYVVHAIAASMIQTRGSSHGLYWDPVRMEPLVGSAAYEAAFRIYKALLQYAAPLDWAGASSGSSDNSSSSHVPSASPDWPLKGCYSSHPGFHSVGICAMSIEWDVAIQLHGVDPPPLAKGRLGMALLPGSTHYLDRPTNTLRACTPEACPLAQRLRAPLVPPAAAGDCMQPPPSGGGSRALRAAPGPGYAACGGTPPAALAAVPPPGAAEAEQLVNLTPLGWLIGKERPSPLASGNPNSDELETAGVAGTASEESPTGAPVASGGGGSSRPLASSPAPGGPAGRRRDLLQQQQGNGQAAAASSVGGVPLAPRGGALGERPLQQWPTGTLDLSNSPANIVFEDSMIANLEAWTKFILSSIADPSDSSVPRYPGGRINASSPHPEALVEEQAMDPQDAAAFVAAYWPAATHPNLALEPALAGMPFMQLIAAEAVQNVTVLGAGVPGVVAAMEERWADTLAFLYMDEPMTAALRAAYWELIGYTPPPPSQLGEGASSQGGDNGLAVVVWVPLLCGGLLLVALAAVLLLYRRLYLKVTLLGKVIAPGAGPATTLVVVDVQDSDALWRDLPAHVMDAALDLHRDACRRLLPKHRGYESAMAHGGEGFVLAFHKAHEALAYCLELQDELLVLDWPQQLLEHAHAAPVWLQPMQLEPGSSGADTQYCAIAMGMPPLEGHKGTAAVALTMAPPSPSPAAKAYQQLRRSMLDVSSGGKTEGPSGTQPAPPTPTGGDPQQQQQPAWCAADAPQAVALALDLNSSGTDSKSQMYRSLLNSASGRRARLLQGLMEQVSAAFPEDASAPHTGGSRSARTHPAARQQQPQPAGQLQPAVVAAGLPLQPAAAGAGAGVDNAGSTAGGQDSVRQGAASIFSLLDRTAMAGAFDEDDTCSSPAAENFSVYKGLAPTGGPPAQQLLLQQYSNPCFTGNQSSISPPVTGASLDPDQGSRFVAGAAAAGAGATKAAAAAASLQQTSSQPERDQAATIVGAGKSAARNAGGLGRAPSGLGRAQQRPQEQGAGAAVVGLVLSGGRDVPERGGCGGREEHAGDEDDDEGVPFLQRRAAQLAKCLERLWPTTGVCPAPCSPQEGLIYRGLRVRTGLACGVSPSEISFHAATGRTVYEPGACLARARQVAGAAHGSMVLLHGSVFAHAPAQALRGSLAPLVVHMGDHVVAEGQEQQPLYEAVAPALAARLVAAPRGLATLKMLCSGALDAPVGCPTVVHMHVTGAATLLAWRADVAEAALGMWERCVRRLLLQHRGYLVESGPGLCLAAFREAAYAAIWAFSATEAMLDMDWPEALLEHELCEEWAVIERQHPGTILSIAAGQPQAAAAGRRPLTASAADIGSAPLPAGRHDTRFHNGYRHRVLLRGLRLKVGLDTGPLLHTISAETGHVVYRGPTVERAARIAALASGGQVLMGPAAAALAQCSPVFDAANVAAASIGRHGLRGFAGKVEVFRVLSAEDYGFEGAPAGVRTRLTVEGEEEEEQGNAGAAGGVAPGVVAPGAGGGGIAAAGGAGADGVGGAWADGLSVLGGAEVVLLGGVGGLADHGYSVTLEGSVADSALTGRPGRVDALGALLEQPLEQGSPAAAAALAAPAAEDDDC